MAKTINLASRTIKAQITAFFLLTLIGIYGQAAEYVGSSTCAACHEAEFKDWNGSHHQLAMAEATSETVLGNFNDARFEYNGIVSTFFTEDGVYKITTDNAEGELETFDIAHTFGWEPLQQYLIEFDDGRMQTLSIAWDSRAASEGGQRWFHLYPDESVHAGDVLHWTGFGMNWNTNCAECHSTHLEKNYDAATNTFNTTWSEISVGCEACHGAGSGHLNWNAERSDDPLKGFEFNLFDTNQWARALDQDTAVPASNKVGIPKEQEVCASCHARRFKLGVDQDNSFYNNHQIQPVTPSLYHEDGQILDEVYVYGSFLQSKMHAAGVTCSNCHNPHTAELKAPGDAVCLQCHSPQTFSSVDHHLHSAESEGARCVNCHMPETVYMVVDPRRDHSIRIPRPDLDTPNACNQCHTDQSSEWAAETLASVHGTPARNLGESLRGIWRQDQPSLNRLLRLLGENETPGFVRGSAVEQLGQHADQRALNAAINALNDDYAPVRLGAINSLAGLPLQNRFQYLYPLLEDENSFVRQQATASLAEVPIQQLPENAQSLLLDAFGKYESDLKSSLDNPAIAAQLGNFYSRRGQVEDAIAAYSQARVIEPRFVPALLNLADLYRSTGDEENSLATLIEAEELERDQPDINYALGLAYVRAQQRELAGQYFEVAVALMPENTSYRYAWVLTLFETGNTEQAIQQTLAGLDISPNDQQLRYTLGYFYEQTGDADNAIDAYQQVLQLNPNHRGAAQQLRQLQ